MCVISVENDDKMMRFVDKLFEDAIWYECTIQYMVCVYV